jgi:hypothetical protein
MDIKDSSAGQTFAAVHDCGTSIYRNTRGISSKNSEESQITYQQEFAASPAFGDDFRRI